MQLKCPRSLQDKPGMNKGATVKMNTPASLPLMCTPEGDAQISDATVRRWDGSSVYALHPL